MPAPRRSVQRSHRPPHLPTHLGGTTHQNDALQTEGRERPHMSHVTALSRIAIHTNNYTYLISSHSFHHQPAPPPEPLSPNTPPLRIIPTYELLITIYHPPPLLPPNFHPTSFNTINSPFGIRHSEFPPSRSAPPSPSQIAPQIPLRNPNITRRSQDKPQLHPNNDQISYFFTTIL